MKSSFSVGIVQSSFVNGQIQQNIDKMKKWVHQAVGLNPAPRLILFPELSATGYFLSPEIRECRQTQEGFIAQQMAEAARECHICVAYGYAEQGKGDETYNSLMLLDSHGKQLANYRKTHLTPLEKKIFTPGHEWVTAATEIGTIGLMICWDLAFPEAARKLALDGAELLLAPSAWERPFHEPYKQFSMARAIDNTVFLATCNHVGVSGDLSFFGESAVYGPDGKALSLMAFDCDGNIFSSFQGNMPADASIGIPGDREALLIANIEPQKREELKSAFFTMMDERRIDLY